MTRLLRSLLVPLTLAIGLPVALLAAPAAALAGDPCYHDFDLPAHSASASSSVQARPCAFTPTVAYVPVGTTVTFANESGQPHLITGANQEWGSRDEELAASGTVAYAFDKAGVYPYACALHRGMSGTIIVGDAPLTAAVLPPADGVAGGSGDGSTLPADTGPDWLPFPGGAAAGVLAVLVCATIVLASRRRSATTASATATTDATSR